MEDFDAKRSTNLLLRHATKRLLTPAEVRTLHLEILSADMDRGEQGVAIAMVNKANNGKVLSWEESLLILNAIEKEWQTKPAADMLSSGGTRDQASTCKKCACRGKNCPECTGCQFSLEGTGGYIRNSLSGPPLYKVPAPAAEDCGCTKGV